MAYGVNSVTGVKKACVSFVIPVKDEQATLAPLFRGIANQVAAIAAFWEVIFVDDGSCDGSWAAIEQLAAENVGHVKAIRFRHNAGKAAALAAGWKMSKGDIVFTMDADLQDDPEEIPRFLEKMGEGFDVVTGWKRDRHDPWHKVLPSRIFNFILSRVNKVHLHDHNCGFKCYRREVIQSLPMYGEMHRMVPSLAAMQGFRTAEIPVKHHPRRHGRSKYGVKRFLRGFLDMWTVFFLQNFRERPMHLMGAVSLLMIGGGGCLALFLARVTLPLSVFLLLSPALPALLIGALLTAMIGLLAEWNVHKSAESGRPQPIAQTIGMVGMPSIGVFSDDQSLVGSEAPPGATALLLADKLANRELNAGYLRQAGWKVLTAGSCEEARAKLNSEVDVVLLDPYVQDGTGLSVADFVRSVRENPRSPGIIFLSSGEADVSNGPEVVRNGALYHRINAGQMASTAAGA
jgi:CheY-like chemotaxis protein